MRITAALERNGSRSRIPLALAIAAVYFAAAKLGLSMAFVAEQVSAVWPPTGIALAALVAFGLRAWPGIAIGAFVANVSTHEPVATALGIALGNTLEALVGAWLLRSVGFRSSLARSRDALAVVLLAAVLSTTISATIGVTSLCLGGVHPWSAFRSLFGVWWLGDAMGDLVVAPALLTCASVRRITWRRRRLAEAAALAAMLLAVSLFVFGSPGSPGRTPRMLEYLVFPCIIWAALRFPPITTSLATLVVSGIAIWGTSEGLGPFGATAVGDNLVMLVTFMAVVAVTGLLLAAGIAERNTTERQRTVANAVTKVLTESPTLGDATARILRAICEVLGWDVGGIWLVDSEGAQLQCLDVWHRSSIDVREFEKMTRALTFRPGVGMPGRVWESGKPVWIPDVVADPNFPRARVASAEGLHAAFGFPILLGSRVLGVIEFFSSEIRAPEPELLSFMAALGSQLGLVIDRKRSAEEREQLLGREQAARAEAERLFREAREQDRRKDEFLAMLGHELRNPLAPLRNAVHLLGTASTNPDTMERVRGIMERQIGTLTRLVDDLLDVSRITRGTIALALAPVDLAAIVQVAVDTMRPLIDAQGHHLSIALPTERVTLVADATRLEQVLTNLLHNAVKYTEPGGRIWLTVTNEADGAETVIRVCDSGSGIPSDLLPHIFELFTQERRSLDRSKGGLGIGLTLVRSLVELQGGTVSAYSAGAGRGSEFVVRLPHWVDAASSVALSPTAPAAGTAATRAAAWGNAAGGAVRRVLVVEDNADVAQSLAMLLETWGHEVQTVADGAAALSVAEKFRPQAVLLDIGLPGIDGYEVAQRIRKHPDLRRVLIVAMTGYGQPEDHRRSHEAEIDHHLVKPVDPLELDRILNAHPPSSA